MDECFEAQVAFEHPVGSFDIFYVWWFVSAFLSVPVQLHWPFETLLAILVPTLIWISHYDYPKILKFYFILQY